MTDHTSRVRNAIKSYFAVTGRWPRRVVWSTQLRMDVIVEARESRRYGQEEPMWHHPVEFYSARRLPPNTLYCDDGGAT